MSGAPFGSHFCSLSNFSSRTFSHFQVWKKGDKNGENWVACSLFVGILMRTNWYGFHNSIFQGRTWRRSWRKKTNFCVLSFLAAKLVFANKVGNCAIYNVNGRKLRCNNFNGCTWSWFQTQNNLRGACNSISYKHFHYYYYYFAPAINREFCPQNTSGKKSAAKLWNSARTRFRRERDIYKSFLFSPSWIKAHRRKN